MKLNDYFKKFHGNIALDPTRQDRITKAYEIWKGILKEDEEISKVYNDCFLQGSYASSTAIRPKKDKEFDVDVVLLMNLDDEMTAKEAINFVKDRIKTKEKYKDKVKPKDRCIRIEYSKDFHIDIVPAKPTDKEYILIPSKKEDEWKKTNPQGFTKWCANINSKSSEKFTRIVKMIKYWRDLKVGKDTAPKSILLNTLIGLNMIGKNSDAESLVLTLEKMVENLDNILDENDDPKVDNPSLKGENLARDWDKTKFDIFKTKLEKFAEDARAAHDEEDKEKSIEKWKDIFGIKFPRKLEEESQGAKMANETKSNNAYVNSQGHLNSASEGQAIKEHRFFGGIDFVEPREKRKKYMKTPKPNLTMQKVQMELKFPQLQYKDNKSGDSYWIGTLQPTPQSTEYKIKIEYGKRIPKVYILEPQILDTAPHKYPDNSLCLYYPKDRSFDKYSIIAETIVPWTCEWLFFYERWIEEGVWWGKEAPHKINSKQGKKVMTKYKVCGGNN